MNTYQAICNELTKIPRTWLITGAAGFIGSNLLEALLKMNQNVSGLDNFSTGYPHNLDQVRTVVTQEQWQRFTFIKGDIRDFETCQKACVNMDYILHQAALGSVPRSLEDPIQTNANNISGFLNILTAARDARVKRFVYAASSSTYGDYSGKIKREDRIGRPLSPYAVTKYVNELYSDVFRRCYDFSSIGLRYFNIFGPRQDPNGAYAAVIPKWFDAFLTGKNAYVFGDGETSRDFCYVDNAIQANILAACTDNPDALGQVFNIAYGQRTTLNELFGLIRNQVIKFSPDVEKMKPVYKEFRAGDVRHSLADITKACNILGYEPSYSASDGLTKTADWFIADVQ